MIIECGSCNSRFRLDASKITGKGARVRCRKCGEAITVMKEEPGGQGAQDEGLDLRSILRETMEAPTAPEAPAAEPPGSDAPQSDFERMMADAVTEAEAETAAPQAAAQREQPQAGGVTVDFGPEEEISFAPPVRSEPASGEAAREAAQAPPKPPPAHAAPAPSPEFMMSTSDSLDFLKADYDQGEQKAALDISGSLRVAPASDSGERGIARPLGTQAASAAPPAEPLSRSEQIRSELAALGSAGAAAAGAAPAEPARGKIAAPPPPPPPSPPPREAAAAKPSPAVRRTPARTSPGLKRGQSSRRVRPTVVLLLLLFFALAGGGAYLGFTSDGQRVLRGLVPQIESLWLGGGKPAARYEVGNLIGYYETNAAAGKMFVVKGQVTNEGALRKTGVRVHATLLDAQSRKLAEKSVYAGNVFAGEALRQAPREKIEAAMSNPIGGGLANMDIPPGKAVPFMVVFFDPPDGIDSYRLEPRDVD